MLWNMLAAFGLRASQGGGGAPGRDFRSIPNEHWGSGIANSGDPFNLFGHSGSNVMANMGNPLGFGAGPSWLNPNNNPNPSAQPGYASRLDKTGPNAGAPGQGTLTSGIGPGQSLALYNSYLNFMRNLGMPMGGAPRPPAGLQHPPPSGGPTGGGGGGGGGGTLTPPPNNYPALLAIASLGAGGGGHAPGSGPTMASPQTF